MYLERAKNLGKILFQKNILCTFLVFSIGIILGVTESTLIILTFFTAAVSTWWQWRPILPNASTEFILEVLNVHPASFIKGYSHLIVLRTDPVTFTAVYQSPVPYSILKRHLFQIEEFKISIANFREDSFLVLQHPLLPVTEPRKIIRQFNRIIELIEVIIQEKFMPAERFQLVHLFNLDYHVTNPLYSENKNKPRNKNRISAYNHQNPLQLS
ncbi:MAG: hypothetical protein ACFE9L_12855 [Candidatus Hodarchaeota archaeon]